MQDNPELTWAASTGPRLRQQLEGWTIAQVFCTEDTDLVVLNLTRDMGGYFARQSVTVNSDGEFDIEQGWSDPS